MVIADDRLKLEKDANKESDSENNGARGKVKRKHILITLPKKGMWEAFTMAWQIGQSLSKKL